MLPPQNKLAYPGIHIQECQELCDDIFVTEFYIYFLQNTTLGYLF